MHLSSLVFAVSVIVLVFAASFMVNKIQNPGSSFGEILGGLVPSPSCGCVVNRCSSACENYGSYCSSSGHCSPKSGGCGSYGYYPVTGCPTGMICIAMYTPKAGLSCCKCGYQTTTTSHTTTTTTRTTTTTMLNVTSTFVNIRINPISGITVYNQSFIYSSNLNGIQISSDTANSLRIGNLKSRKFYLLFDKISGNNYPVILSYWDDASATSQVYQMINSNLLSVSYYLITNYAGKDTPYFIGLNFVNKSYLITSAGINNRSTIYADYNFLTQWTSSNIPQLKLGSTTSSEATDIMATIKGSSVNIGSYTNDVVDDSGIIIMNPYNFTSVNSVSLKIPV